MAVDVRFEGSDRTQRPGPSLTFVLPAPVAPRWAFEEALDAVRIVLWGEIGSRETAGVDAELLTLRSRSVPLLFDLTGVTALDEDAVAWLGQRHTEFGRERPMVVSVISEGEVHDRLARSDAPQLRLTLE